MRSLFHAWAMTMGFLLSRLSVDGRIHEANERKETRRSVLAGDSSLLYVVDGRIFLDSSMLR